MPLLKNASELAPMLKSELLGQGIMRWSEANASAAARFLDENPEAILAERRDMPSGFSMIAGQVAERWALSDPPAAMEWSRKRADASSAMQGAMRGWWQNDPDGAVRYVMQHLETNTDHQVASIVAERMAAQDPKRAVEWIAQLPNERARGQAEITVASSWAFRDPQAASAWAEALPPNERQGTLSSIVVGWARNDPQAAGQWVSTLSGPGRDEAIATYGSAIARLDPTTALSWTLQVNDERMRNGSIREIISVWMSQDMAAATSWVQQSNLSPEQKSRLLPATPGH